MLGRDRVDGRWDRVDQTGDGPSVVDYKSTAIDEGSERPQQLANQDLQLRLYALAHEKMYGARPTRATLHFLETGARGTIQPSDTDMSVVRTVVTSTAAKIRARHFAPAPVKGINAGFKCAYHQICPSSLTVRG